MTLAAHDLAFGLMETRTLDPADDAQLRRFHEITWRAEKEDGRPWNPMWTFEEMAGLLPRADQRPSASRASPRMTTTGWSGPAG